MTTRTCDCPHQFPFCVCALGYPPETVPYHSRLASAIIGWPSRRFDPDAVDAHNARMAAALAERQAREAVAMRAAKPRIPLGVKLGSAACGPCREAKQESVAPTQIN